MSDDILKFINPILLSPETNDDLLLLRDSGPHPRLVSLQFHQIVEPSLETEKNCSNVTMDSVQCCVDLSQDRKKQTTYFKKDSVFIVSLWQHCKQHFSAV